MSVVRVSILAVLAAVVPQHAGDAAPRVAPGGSFFEPFDRIDEKRWYISDGWVNGDMQGCSWSRANVRTASGNLQLHLTKGPNRLRNYRCAEIRTHGRLGYGLYEARMRVAAGSGLNTAMFTYSGPPSTKVHDEIDFEFLGKQPGSVQLNYFVSAKGGHETYVPLAGSGAAGFNRYAFEWLPGSMKWYVNGRLVWSAVGGVQPTVPGQFFLSLWSGTASVDGWLGKFDPGRVPTLAEVDWVAFTAAGQRCLFAQSVSCARR